MLIVFGRSIGSIPAIELAAQQPEIAALILESGIASLRGVTNGERLHAYGGGENKRLLVFPAGDHNDIMIVNFKEHWEAVRDFVIVLP